MLFLRPLCGVQFLRKIFLCKNVSPAMTNILDKLPFSKLLFHLACITSIVGTSFPTITLCVGDEYWCGGIHYWWRGIGFLPFSLMALCSSVVLKRIEKMIDCKEPLVSKQFFLMFCYFIAFLILFVIDVILLLKLDLRLTYQCILIFMIVNSVFYMIVVMYPLLREGIKYYQNRKYYIRPSR